MRVQWPPISELLQVLDKDIVDCQIRRPTANVPRCCPGLVLFGATSSGIRMVRAFGACGQNMEAASRDLLSRLHCIQRFTFVADARVIQRVRVDGNRPMIDRQQVQIERHFPRSSEHSLAGSAGATEQISSFNRLHDPISSPAALQVPRA